MGPYAIAGLGIYNTNSSCSGCASNSNSNVGINGGGGFRFGLGGFSAFVEARYHYVPGKNGNPKTTFVPITFGVTF